METPVSLWILNVYSACALKLLMARGACPRRSSVDAIEVCTRMVLNGFLSSEGGNSFAMMSSAIMMQLCSFCSVVKQDDIGIPSTLLISMPGGAVISSWFILTTCPSCQFRSSVMLSDGPNSVPVTTAIGCGPTPIPIRMGPGVKIAAGFLSVILNASSGSIWSRRYARIESWCMKYVFRNEFVVNVNSASRLIWAGPPFSASTSFSGFIRQSSDMLSYSSIVKLSLGLMSPSFVSHPSGLNLQHLSAISMGCSVLNVSARSVANTSIGWSYGTTSEVVSILSKNTPSGLCCCASTPSS